MIYLDNAATSFPNPDAVWQAISKYGQEIGASPGRGSYEAALKAGRLVLQTRKKLAALLDAANPLDIIFTPNATYALNLALKGLLKAGDYVVTTKLEHSSVLRPLLYLQKKKQVKVEFINCSPEGELNFNHFKFLLDKKPKLVVLTHASNVLGSILPIAKVTEMAHQVGAKVLVDAAQTAGCVPLSVSKSGLDMLAFTGHKSLLGPQGAGGLYIAPDLEIEELIQGGTGGSSGLEQPLVRPDRYESGTLNTPAIVGLGAALDFVQQKGVDSIFQTDKEKVWYFMDKLLSLKKVQLFGPKVGIERVPLIALKIKGLPSQQAAYFLDKEYKIAVRGGLHCAPSAHMLLGTEAEGLVRFSISYFTSYSELDYAFTAVKDLTEKTLS
jgi:cysteine desulfurase family protein